MNKRTTMKKREVSRRSLLVNSVSGLSTVMMVSYSPGTLTAQQSAPRTAQSGSSTSSLFSPLHRLPRWKQWPPKLSLAAHRSAFYNESSWLSRSTLRK